MYCSYLYYNLIFMKRFHLLIKNISIQLSPYSVTMNIGISFKDFIFSLAKTSTCMYVTCLHNYFLALGPSYKNVFALYYCTCTLYTTILLLHGLHVWCPFWKDITQQRNEAPKHHVWPHYTLNTNQQRLDLRLKLGLKCYCSYISVLILNLHLNLNFCQLVFNVWWDHTWCFSALFRCFMV